MKRLESVMRGVAGLDPASARGRAAVAYVLGTAVDCRPEHERNEAAAAVYVVDEPEQAAPRVVELRGFAAGGNEVRT